MRRTVPLLAPLLLALPALAGDECDELAGISDDVADVADLVGLADEGDLAPATLRRLDDIASTLGRWAEQIAAGPSASADWRRAGQDLSVASRRLQARLRGDDLDALVGSLDSLVDELDDMVHVCEESVAEGPDTTPAPSPQQAPPRRADAAPAQPTIPAATRAPPPAARGESGRQVGMTAAHNAVRAAVDGGARGSLPPLVWSPRLAATAQAWSDRLARQGCGLTHSTGGLGENLAVFGGTRATPAQVVAVWLEERACYTYGPIGHAAECRAPCAACGHYTQIVWRDARRVGCGVAPCDGDAEVWTCNYEPAGNTLGFPPY